LLAIREYAANSADSPALVAAFAANFAAASPANHAADPAAALADHAASAASAAAYSNADLAADHADSAALAAAFAASSFAGSPFVSGTKTSAHWRTASRTSGWLIPGLTFSSVSSQ
jgi:hypothetical protein